ncbi:MAG TPA: protein rep [Bacteroidia bacterium]|nr:protein rep [Bacteroidia bacterium]
MTGKQKRNLIRARKIGEKSRQNDMFSNDIIHYIKTHTNIEEKKEADLFRFMRNINSCSRLGLFGQTADENTFIAAHTCKHKLCAVCNWRRSEIVRMKYFTFLKEDVLIKKTIKKGIEKIDKIEQKDIDFMHLTLTVPHKKGLFKGEKWYAHKLIEYYNSMRKEDFWKENVVGGEYGVELTKGKEGLHIHIHSLLLVKKSNKNRNKLHKNILIYWNKVTSEKGDKSTITEKRKDAILKGNELLKKSDLKKIKGTGSTIIGLNLLFVYSKKPLSDKDIWIENIKMYKHYINYKEGKLMRGAIMECIKYHFEPVAILDESGHLNVEFVAEVLPLIYGKPLYRKFGFLHGIKQLNVNYKEQTLLEEIVSIAENAIENLFVKRERYVAVDCRRIFVFDNKLVIKGNDPITILQSTTALGAANELIQIQISREMQKKNKPIEIENFPEMQNNMNFLCN